MISWRDIRPGDWVRVEHRESRHTKAGVVHSASMTRGSLTVHLDCGPIIVAQWKLISVVPVQKARKRKRQLSESQKDCVRKRQETQAMGGCETMRAKVLQLLRDAKGSMRVMELAPLIDRTPGAVHQHLNALLKQGKVGRDGVKYVALDAGQQSTVNGQRGGAAA